MANAYHGNQVCGPDGVPVPLAHSTDVTTAQTTPVTEVAEAFDAEKGAEE